MFLSELKIWNFRKFGEGENSEPGLHLSFNSGLNLLVGENDSGKTAIVDAIKMVLFTQSYEYYRFEDEDFFIPDHATEEDRTNELKIECIFREFAPYEAKNFLEWLGLESGPDGKNQYFLKVFFKARRENGRIYGDARAGSDEQGTALDGKARDLLRTVFLRPLRDAEIELNPRRKSRLSQILYSHKDFSEKEEHPLKKAVDAANEQIQKFFKETDSIGCKKEGTNVVCQINDHLSHFSSVKNPLKSSISIEGKNLRTILEQLSLSLSNNKIGLGSNNLLFIATEFLLLKREDYAGLKLTLIEEIEAHLHPQAQLRLIGYLQNESEINISKRVQLILTTHSPNLASKVKLENLIICKNGNVFNMGYEHTRLEKGDYLFLERFLDVTKANLFFADGVILVEGDAENLLIPTIAEIIDLPLVKHGVSIVNVGSTAFLRYSRIFQREHPEILLKIPVAVITDSDEKPDEYYENEEIVSEKYSERIQKTIKAKKEIYDGIPVKTFVSPDWTLEYVIALSDFKKQFYKAVLQAEKIQNSDKIGLTNDKKEQIKTQVKIDFDKWGEGKLSDEKIAFEIYNNIILKKQISKAIIAQCFAMILSKSKHRDKIKEKLLNKTSKLNYIIDAITYAISGPKKKSEVSDD